MSDYLAIVPLVCVWFGGILAMLAEAFRSPGEQMPMEGIAIGVLLTAGATARCLWDRGAVSFGVVTADNFGLFVTLVLVVVGILTVLLSSQVVERDEINAGEYYALTLFAIGGMMLMATATDLLVIFIALEILSLAVYILTGIRRESKAGAEAAFKYFLLGGFSSAFFLYGIAFTYGIAGTTRLDEIVVVMSGLSAGNEVLTLHRAGAAAGRLRVQGVGRAVPHVDARRLRRCAGGRHGVHVGRREGGGVRGVRPRVHVGLRRAAAAVGAGHLDALGGVDDSRRRWPASCSGTCAACSRIRASRTRAIC